MGVDPVSIALIAGSAMSAVSEVAQGFSEKKAADNNARAYEIQAQNIETQKGITSTQYRNKANRRFCSNRNVGFVFPLHKIALSTNRAHSAESGVISCMGCDGT